MFRLGFRISMSLDGFVAGPSQSVDHPLGVGGTRLHEWAFPLAGATSKVAHFKFSQALTDPEGAHREASTWLPLA